MIVLLVQSHPGWRWSDGPRFEPGARPVPPGRSFSPAYTREGFLRVALRLGTGHRACHRGDSGGVVRQCYEKVARKRTLTPRRNLHVDRQYIGTIRKSNEQGMSPS